MSLIRTISVNQAGRVGTEENAVWTPKYPDNYLILETCLLEMSSNEKYDMVDETVDLVVLEAKPHCWGIPSAINMGTMRYIIDSTVN